MAISTHFQGEIDEVDNTKALAFVVDAATYDFFEFSYAYSGSTYTITGGSDLGCEYGAAQLLHDLGFRYYTSSPEFWKRPASITTGLSKAKGEWWFTNNTVFLVYGHSWGGTHSDWRTTLQNQMAKWQTLTGLGVEAYPAGHRWSGIVSSNLAYFQANPQLILGGNPSALGVTFDLSVTGDDYDNLVEICAAQLLKDGLNAWNRTHFDPSDGDLHTSDQIVAFTVAVGARVRSGTDAIGTHPARTGNANAELGIYAYAGHRLPPTETLSPHYAQVALGFNATDLTYEELVDQWAAKSSVIMLREYLSTEVWDAGYPHGAKGYAGYFDRYDAFHASGATGTKSEVGANWLANFTMLPAYIHKLRTGVTVNHADMIDDIAADIFESDPAVIGLLNYWSDLAVAWDKWALRTSADYVNDMVDSWYKTYFEQIITIWKKDMYRPLPTPAAGTPEGDAYRVYISQLLKWTAGVALSDIMHSYAKVRQRANSALAAYPDLKFNASPEPDWYANAAAPTHDDFVTAYAEIQADTVRDTDLDNTDLVLVTGITPRVTPTSAQAPATKFFTINRAKYKFVGPGTVSVQLIGEGNVPTGDPAVTTYGAGIHNISLYGSYEVSCAGGHLFLDGFPGVRKDPDGTGRYHWVYIPTRFEGEVDIRAVSRVSVVDQNGGLDIMPEGHASYVSPADLGPGQIAISNSLTTNTFSLLGAGRYISMNPSVALLPREIADEDFPVRIAVNVP